MVKVKASSLADQVFDRLEQDILGGVYPRDSYLTELQLCEALGVSRTPIREALRRLEQEHIVEATGKGMRVLSITEEDVEAIYEIRAEVERLAVENCIRFITEEQITAMREIVDMQEFYLSKNNPEQLKEMDSEFHKSIYEACSSSVFYDTLMPLVTKIQKVRKTSLTDPNRAPLSVGEHRAILNAIAARNGRAAGDAMFAHIHNAHSHIAE